MSTFQRFQHLKNNGLCFQCPYSGAQIDTGKHKDGKCHLDFICKHLVHQKYPTKKDVFVCDKHKTKQENRDTLEH